ncbi:MAG: glycosyltransferase family 4 protein [Candidatus Nanoarchaeia archaeon]|nr:glycosyltransferase family 4 protein [Candidatus Nanoarchaeia archaeon]
MKILLLNWRDLKNPDAGGAELYVHRLFTDLAEKGYDIDWFCSSFKNCNIKESYDGINFIRRGTRVSVVFYAFFHYLFNKYDFVVEAYNGVPWGTPIYVRKKKMGIFFHRLGDVYIKELGSIVGGFSKFFEDNLMKLIYKRMKFVTISESSKKGMIEIGLKEKNISIINPGVDLAMFKRGRKTIIPTICSVGRLNEYKSIDHLIKAMPLILKKVKNASLLIAGRGYKEKELKDLVNSLGLQNNIKFLGFISNESLSRLYNGSWVLVNTSMKEGWGLTAIDAAASGTAIINADSPGLRETVLDNENGFLYKYGNIEELSEKIIKILTDSELRKKFEKKGIEFGKQFDWNRINEKFFNLINNFINN